MSIAPAVEVSWYHRLQLGTLDVSDLEILDALRIDKVVEQLKPLFPHQFLDVKRRNKWEIGLAKSARRTRSKERTSPDAALSPSFFYRHCMLLTGEFGFATTLATMTSLRIRPSRQEIGSFEISSGGGFDLYKDVDGWKIKLLEERTVCLSTEFMTKRGWVFSC